MKQSKLTLLLLVLMSMISNKALAYYEFISYYKGHDIFYNIVDGNAQVSSGPGHYSGNISISQTVTYG